MALTLAFGSVAWPAAGRAQNSITDTTKPGRPETVERGAQNLTLGATRVGAAATVSDSAIRARIQSVLKATNWFTNPTVRVDAGVVFLDGTVKDDDTKRWAGDLARNTEGVGAVVNRMTIQQPSIWDFGTAMEGLRKLGRDTVRAIPLILFSLVILGAATGVAVLASRGARRMLDRRIGAKLLRAVLAKAVGVLVILTGVYVVLRVLGLTQLAMTVLGGTGLLGLILGIAFRSISENFLASIFLSIQRPFGTGDLVEIEKTTGYVQQLNLRTTILLTLDGNQVQIPNSTVYASHIRNFTTSPNRREDFVVGIGYDDAITEAQEIARGVLANHPAVLDDPEPWVLVDTLGGATVNLRVYFWLDGSRYSWLKVRSSVIRLVKRAFQERGISMPDQAREVLFPKGVPVTIVDERARGVSQPLAAVQPDETAESEDVATPSESGLSSEASTIEKQARTTAPDSENLLESSD